MNRQLESVLVHMFRVPVGPPDVPRGSYAKVEVMRASPRYLRYRLLGVVFLTAIYALVELGFGITALAVGEFEPLLIAGALTVLALPGLFFAYLAARIDYDLRYYVITDRSLRVRQGAWVLDEKTLTFANVQNVSVTQGPVQRLFRISDVRVDTAGGGTGAHGKEAASSGHGVILAGLENAGAVRDVILAHLRARGNDAGLGDADDERASRSRVSPRASLSSAELVALREVASAASALRATAQRRAGAG